MTWQPATIQEVEKIIEEDAISFDEEQAKAWGKYKVVPYRASISRHDEIESVVVVARKDDHVIYWEDIEEGFNTSPIDSAGTILEHWCNQDCLSVALNSWIPSIT